MVSGALALTLVAGAAWVLRPDDLVDLAVAANTACLVFGLGAGIGALALLVRDRYFGVGHPAPGLAAVVLMLGCYLLPRSLPTVLELQPGSYHPALGSTQAPATSTLLGLHATDVLVVICAAVLLTFNPRHRAWRRWAHPLLTGPALGMTLSLGFVLTDERFVLTNATFLGAAVVLVVLSSVVIATALVRLRGFSVRVRGIFLAALVANVVANAFPGGTLSDPEIAWIAILGVFTSALLIPAGAGLALAEAVTRHRRDLVQFEGRAFLAERGVHRDQELLHELRASMAGLNGATRLLQRTDTPLDADRTRMLRRLVDAEMERLLALLRDDSTDPTGSTGSTARRVDVATAVAPILSSHRLQGLDVTMDPVCLDVVARSAHLGQAVNVLLHNVARHAPGASVVISAARVGETVEIRVRDDGPGVARDVVPQLFAREAKRSDSPGEGVGLVSARRVIREDAGDLWHEPSTMGTTFVIRLGAAP